ncbi:MULTISPECIES: diiron oxygenase [Streptomyces]|uniref:diiron oxygenase n=1 Tax=Streptomyces TaxID=1883 RepID=UPI00093EF0BE|nr:MULTISPECIES: diiron oxygenase [unclassified Streptomyces]QNQ37258.1 diiron oxygenase [Streptomyces sp. CB00271]
MRQSESSRFLDEALRGLDGAEAFVAAGYGAELAGSEYRSCFENWDRRASVRVKPARTLAVSEVGQVYFPPELVPVASHPLVAAAEGSVERLLVQRLHHYLHFTTELEQFAVIPVTADISAGRAGLRLPRGMILDAYRITTDEAWHAQFSYELAEQVALRTGVPAVLPRRPQFLDRLDEVGQGLDPDLRGLERLLFSIVSETLISAVLADLPRDKRLPAAVRELIRDHAEDEGKHHAYFRVLLSHFWSALDARTRRRIGPLVPELICCFLEPDYRAMSLLLLDAGLPVADAQGVLADSYPRREVLAEIAKSAQSTVRYFREVGALDDTATYEAFAAAGLVD